MNTTIDSDLADLIRQIFGAGDVTDRLSQTTDGVAFDDGLWKQLADLGLVRLTGTEAAGGSGASWYECAALLSEAAANAVHLPLAESDLLAGWLLDRAGLPCDDSPRTVAVADSSGRAPRVPWAGEVERVVAVVPRGDRVTVADLAAIQVEATRLPNLSGLPAYDVEVPAGLSGNTVDPGVLTTLKLRGALIRAIQCVGAMERILAMCVEYAGVRVQFGRPVGRFQSVQNLIADIAAEVALAGSAVDAAVVDAVETELEGAASVYRVAVARSCVGHAASVVVRNAHQVHGAIGTTLEHPLPLFTLPVMDWRGDFGGTLFWDRVLGALVESDPTALWELVTAGSTAQSDPRALVAGVVA
ncbi:acyl-CoA dehydrogenase family protein [Mycobacterium sp. NAZ190054]|uniref:acyl-CoA dehydrogenase family protein n=1 Tax=Mycobacterium sp. NAZ190054 TaxID=1747766 RepID=UPI0007959C59|nr:acyl-CoA dehydrogenase family protein [Mycobacterium sp. NAZ190054]KWX56498.1 hypothetical protein ASJ79_14330 [Mycobacterium sp. NAZ190054]